MSRLVWQYEGGADGTPVEQCALVGDKVLDDVLGEGTAVRIDGGMIIIEFMEEDERVERPRSDGRRCAWPQAPPPCTGARIRVREAPRPNQGGCGLAGGGTVR